MKVTRRDWFKTATVVSAAAAIRTRLLSAAPAASPAMAGVREIGGRRELFVDRWLIEAFRAQCSGCTSHS